jgi:hypothetical protein
MKRFSSVLALTILIVSLLTAAAPMPTTSIELVLGTELPSTMTVGQTATVSVEVTSDQQFLFAQALPSFFFPGRGVVAVQGGDHAGGGESATLEITFEAKSPTAALVQEGDGVPVHMVVGVRYPGGLVVVRDFVFNVIVVE